MGLSVGYPSQVTAAGSSTTRRPRLRRSDCADSGIRRVRRGRGFGYVGVDGARVSDERTLERIRALAVPPAWRQVWICVDPCGHLQATGIDAAERKQYLYHEAWRAQRDRQKFRRMVEFAKALPRLRRRLTEGLAGDELDEDRVLACAVRLLDVGLFRIGGEEYAEQGGGLGLATLHKDHVSLNDGAIVFDYPAKSGVRRVHEVRDPSALAVIGALKRRRGGGQQLLAYRAGRRWTPVHSEDINDYIKRNLGEGFSAKDFRTWNATVMAAVSVSVSAAAEPGHGGTKTARKRVVDGAVRQVAELLGNTPAVARRAYIDPCVFDRYRAGSTISLPRAGVGALTDADGRPRRRIERAVLDLLAE
jgi:DNA topoisomerase-1